MFLDEIGDIPLGVQAKILRLLQEMAFERLGSNETVRVDVRVLCATNRDLERAIAERTFREDLYHRLDVVTIRVPPLRERRDDTPGTDRLLPRPILAGTGDRQAPGRPGRAGRLREYSWPGNVRELEHLIHRGPHLHPRLPDPGQRLASWTGRRRGGRFRSLFGGRRGGLAGGAGVAPPGPRVPRFVPRFSGLRGVARSRRAAASDRGVGSLRGQPDARRPAAGRGATHAPRQTPAARPPRAPRVGQTFVPVMPPARSPTSVCPISDGTVGIWTKASGEASHSVQSAVAQHQSQTLLRALLAQSLSIGTANARTRC